MNISIVIPVFNEASNLPTLTERLQSALKEIGSHEIIFVNDGSKDTSLETIIKLSKIYATVKYITLSRNYGQQIAISAGLDHASGQYVVIIDADLQDPPELITSLYQKAISGYDVVYAKRKSRTGESAFKTRSAYLFYRLLSRMNKFEMPLDTGDFRIISQKVVHALRRMPERQKFLRGQMAWIGLKQSFVTYDRDERHSGTTGYGLGKMFRLAMDGIVNFSDVPLRLVTYFGFIIVLVTFLLGIYTLYSKYVLNDYVAGWPSLMISILFIGGIQMLAIGIIGEYLSRIHNNTLQRPLYIIEDKKI